MAPPNDPNYTPEFLEAINEKLRDQNELQKEQIALQKALNDAQALQQQTLDKIAKLEDDIKLQAIANVGVAKERITVLKGLEDAEADSFKKAILRKEILQEQTKEQNNLLIKYKEELKSYGEDNTLTEEQKEKKKDILLEINKTINAQQNLVTKTEKQLADDEAILRIGREKLQIKAQEEQIGINIAFQLRDQINSVTGLNSLFKNLVMGMSPATAIVKEMVEQSIKLLDVVSKSNAEFTKTTGQIANFSFNFGDGLSSFGVGYKQLNDATMGLSVSMSGFTNLTRENREALAATTARMNTLGISAATAGKNFDIFTKTLGMTTQKSIQAQDSILKLAIGIGVPPKQMAEDFASAMTRLSAHGEKGIDVFKELQRQSKTLGVSMQQLNSIVGEQFDTFEGSAKAASSLNALLGGNYLNAVSMVYATESDRVDMLRQAIALSGKDVEAMSAQEQKAIAYRLGIKDLTVFRNLMRKQTLEMTAEMAKEEAAQGRLRKAQEAAVTIGEKLVIVFQTFLIVIKPIVYILEQFARGITFVADLFGGLVGKIAGVVLAFKVARIALKAFRIEIELTKAAATFGLSVVLSLAIEQLVDFADASKEASDAISKPRSPPFYLAVKLLGENINYLGDATNKQTSNFNSFTISAAKANQQTQPAVNNINNLSKSLNGINTNNSVTAINSYSDSLSKLNNINDKIASSDSTVFSSIESNKLLMSSNSINAMDKAVSGMISSFNSADEKKITGFSDSLSSLQSLMMFENMDTGLKRIVEALKSISEEINKLPDNKMINFKTSMDSLAEAIVPMASVNETKISNTTKFVSAAKEYSLAQKESRNNFNDSLINTLKSTNTNSTAANVPMYKPQTTVKVELNGKELGSAVVDYINSDPIMNSKPFRGKF